METILFKNDLMKIGTFILNSDDPLFKQQWFVKKPLIVFPKNCIWIQYRGKDPFIADSSLINLYNKQQEYKRFVLNPRGDYCHWIELSNELLHTIHHKEKGDIFSTQNLTCDLKTYLLQAQLFNAFISNHEVEPLELEEIVITIINNISNSMNSRKEKLFSKPVHKKLTERVKSCIHSDLSQNKSLTDIAVEVYSPPYHISRIFKQTTGIGVHQFRNQIRLKSIYNKIQKGQDDLATMALEHGFSSHSHLSYCFKKYFGFTPSSLQQ